MKTAERAHLPVRMWETLELPEAREEAFAIIDRELEYWDPWLIQKVKDRHVRLVENLGRMRARRQARHAVTWLPIKRRVERRNRSREERALSVAHVQYHVKQQLLENLRNGVYEGIYNLDEERFQEQLEAGGSEIEWVDEDEEVMADEEEELVEA